MRNGGFVVFPRKISFAAYIEVFEQKMIPRALLITIVVTVFGSLFSVFSTSIIAYPLSIEVLPGRKIILLGAIFTMLFSGGMIPTYLVVRSLKMTNTLWALMIPGMVWVYNMMVMKSFFENVPQELMESARIDGASEFRILWQVVFPISLPAIMTVGLFYMVGYWNTFMAAIIYISNTRLHPLQPVLRRILMSADMPKDLTDIVVPSETLKMAAVIITAVPIIMVYPFLQKYFVKGMTLGAVKG